MATSVGMTDEVDRSVGLNGSWHNGCVWHHRIARSIPSAKLMQAAYFGYRIRNMNH